MAEDRRGWHLDKNISIPTVLAVLTCIVSIVVWGNTLDKKAEVTAQGLIYLAEKQRDDTKRVDLYRAEIRDELGSINAKLDRLMESKENRR